MPKMSYLVSYLSSFLLCVFSLSPSFAAAQNKSQMANACLDALGSGDMETARDLADQMQDWKNLFGPSVILSAENCLQSVTGDYWKYFSTKGGFLSGNEARTEQAFIDGAIDRKAAKEEKKERLRCEIALAASTVRELENQNKRIEVARAVEALQVTLASCTQIYAADKNSALLNPVCSELFTKVGIPDTQFTFDNDALLVARLNLASLSLMLIEAPTDGSSRVSSESQTIDCQERLLE